MTSGMKKKVVASIAALTMGLGVVASTIPAEAGQFHGGGGHGGWHGGGGGWHGGGGGWHGGGWHGGGYGWHGGGYGWGPGIGLGIVGGLAAGAIVASQYGYGGYGGCYHYVPTYDQWGNYVGRHAAYGC